MSRSESDVVKQARRMLRDLGDASCPEPTECDWSEVLRGVLAERDVIGEWLQRLLDDERGENPNYGPGNPDWERDFDRDGR